MIAPRPELIVVCGATASRKSELALGLAEALGGELICCDSVQVYRGFVIGSAAPNAADLQRVPHHLYQFLAHDEPADAGRYARLADQAIAEIAARKLRPILVGGTGLYLRALLYGLADIPRVDAAVRQRLDRELTADGIQPLWDRLLRVDPDMTARIQGGAANTQRVLRALEVVEGTGQRLSALQAAHQPRLRYPTKMLAPVFETGRHAQRIAARVRQMLHMGWIDEVRGLLEAGVPTDCRPMQALGYKQVAAYLQGALAHGELEPLIARGHRRYARRQRTWFKKEPLARALNGESTDLLDDALTLLSHA